jgi:NitT/TauT family transport system substrate-binding protein
MALHRRSFLKFAGLAGTGAAFGISAPAIVRAATPIKLTLPWLPLGTFSFTFVAKKLGYWEKRGLDVSIDRGFGSTKVCVPVDQGQYDFGLLDMAVLAGCAGRGLDLVGIAGIWPRSPIGIFSLKELNITEPKQLEGQSIGFDVGGGEFQLWPAFVKATGIDARKVNIVSMDAAGLMRAAADKSIKVVGNFFGSIAPTFWANRIDINAMFYEDYGVKMCSVIAACKRATIEKKPEICKAFVEGLLEGLKFAYLNPEKAIDLHVESLKEFQGGAPATREVLFYGQEVGTSLGFVPSFKQHGLGAIDPQLAEVTRQSVETYMYGDQERPAGEPALHQPVCRVGETHPGRMERGGTTGQKRAAVDARLTRHQFCFIAGPAESRSAAQDADPSTLARVCVSCRSRSQSRI